MRRVFTCITAIFLIGLPSSLIYAKPPQNLTCAKNAVIQYYKSGEYEKDVDVVVQDAMRYLNKRIAENKVLAKPETLAVILDIDDTALSNFPTKHKHDFSELTEAINQTYIDANAPAIKPVLRLYNEAINNGVRVFFVSFRPDEFRSKTIKNLQGSGFYGWSDIFLPNVDDLKLSSHVFKTAVREKLTKQGFKIVLNIGDQENDLKGGFAEHINKIPNPLYLTSACPDGC